MAYNLGVAIGEDTFDAMGLIMPVGVVVGVVG